VTAAGNGEGAGVRLVWLRSDLTSLFVGMTHASWVALYLGSGDGELVSLSKGEICLLLFIILPREFDLDFGVLMVLRDRDPMSKSGLSHLLGFSDSKAPCSLGESCLASLFSLSSVSFGFCKYLFSVSVKSFAVLNRSATTKESTFFSVPLTTRIAMLCSLTIPFMLIFASSTELIGSSLPPAPLKRILSAYRPTAAGAFFSFTAFFVESDTFFFISADFLHFST